MPHLIDFAVRQQGGTAASAAAWRCSMWSRLLLQEARRGRACRGGSLLPCLCRSRSRRSSRRLCERHLDATRGCLEVQAAGAGGGEERSSRGRSS